MGEVRDSVLRPTLLQYAGSVAPLAVVIAAALGRGFAVPARRWAAIWCALFIAQDAIAVSLGWRGFNNHWVSYVFQPALGASGLWALAHWQPDSTGRSALRFAIPLVVVVNIGLMLVVDDRSTFSLVASPFHHITLLLAAMWTFLRRSLASEEPLLKQDWFWVTAGIMLFAATGTAIGPLAWYFVGPRVDLLHAMLNVRAAANVAAFAAITWGMLCQSRQGFSGGSSFPLPSRSSSSSAGSASRW